MHSPSVGVFATWRARAQSLPVPARSSTAGGRRQPIARRPAGSGRGRGTTFLTGCSPRVPRAVPRIVRQVRRPASSIGGLSCRRLWLGRRRGPPPLPPRAGFSAGGLPTSPEARPRPPCLPPRLDRETVARGRLDGGYPPAPTGLRCSGVRFARRLTGHVWRSPPAPAQGPAGISSRMEGATRMTPQRSQSVCSGYRIPVQSRPNPHG